jgi:hypothetical protein
MLKKNLVVACLAGFTAAWATGAQAELINVDLQSRTTGAQTEMSGAAGTGSAGDQWNYVNFANGGAGSSATNLFDSSGTPAGVDFTIGGFADVGGFVTTNNSDV